jgi:hypothetical protein
MASPTQTARGPVGAIILSIKMAAISIAIAVTMLLIYGYEFRWYTAFAFGGVGVRRLHRGWLGGLLVEDLPDDNATGGRRFGL